MPPEHLNCIHFRLLGPEKEFPWIAGDCQIALSEVLEGEKSPKLKLFGKQKNKNNEISGGLNNNKTYGRKRFQDKTGANETSKIHDEWVGKKVEEAMTLGSGVKTGKRHGGHWGKGGQDQIRLGGDLTVAEAREWRTRWREVAAMSKRQP